MLFLFEQRLLEDALGAIVLIWAGVGLGAVRSHWNVGFGGGKRHLFHCHDVGRYLVVAGRKLFRQLLGDEPSALGAVHDAERAHLPAVRHHIVLQRGTAAVQDTASHDWAEDVHIDSDSTVYVLFFWSNKYIERVLREMEAEGDSAGIDDLYIAMDDMVWYEAMCREWLEEQGATYYETDASKAVYYRGGVFRTKEESDWGVLVVEPGKEPIFMDYLNFIWTANPSENISPQQQVPQQP